MFVPDNNVETELDYAPLSWRAVALLILTVVVGTAGFLWAVSLAVPGIVSSLLGSEPQAPWYLARASGFVAYILLWLSMVMGLLITGKQAKVWPGGPVAYGMHEYLSLISLAFTVFHVLILLGSAYTAYTVGQLLLPFSGTQYRPLWVGLGQISFYVAILVTVTFYARRWLGPKGWRSVHYLSFATFVLALLHGIYSGADSGTVWASTLYWSTGAATLFLTVYRIIYARLKPARATAGALRQQAVRVTNDLSPA